MSDCLHCDINDLVEEQLKIESTEWVEVAAKIAESLANLILLAPQAINPNSLLMFSGASG